MSEGRSQADQEEIAAIVARLHAEAGALGAGAPPGPSVSPGDAAPLVSRQEADRRWFVSSDRPFVARPGRWGRIRGLALLPVKIVLKKLMRWYVEPPLADQRLFNAAILKTVDEAHARSAADLKRIEQSVRELEERLGRSDSVRLEP